MRGDSVTSLRKTISSNESRLNSLLERLGKFEDEQGRGFDLSAIIPGTDSTLSDIRARHAAIAGLARKFDQNGGSNVPLSFFTAARNALRSIGNSIDQIEASIKNICDNQGLRTFDYESFIAHAKTGHQENFNSSFKTLFDNSESYLASFHSLFQAINPSRASFNFSAATEALSTALANANKTQDSLNKALRGSESALGNIQSKAAELTNVVAKANADATSITEQAGRASEATSQMEANQETIEKIANSAGTLQSTVVEYQSYFDDFQKRLDGRNQEFESGREDLSNLLTELTDQKEYVRTIIDQSDNMLSGATVAGLSSEFKNIRDELTAQVKEAQSTFNWAIVFLFASAIPLIVFIFAPIFGPLISDDERLLASIASAGSEKSGWQYVGQVIARFIILLPAIWFVTFATGRYNSLFKLREHYSYKYSMAVAVEGFKKQAPGHEDMIAALVFEQLAFNPADKMGKQPDGPESPPNPIAQLLVSSLRKSKDSTDS